MKRPVGGALYLMSPGNQGIGGPTASPSATSTPSASPPAGASPAPSLALQRFVSARFGYSVELPGAWAKSSPVDELPDELLPGAETDHADRWDPPVTRSPWLIIAVRDPAPEETIDEWVGRYNGGLATACSAIDPVPVQVDGVSGTLLAGPCLIPGVDIVDVLVVRNGRAYAITIAGVSRDATTNRAIFDQILASFRFTG